MKKSFLRIAAGLLAIVMVFALVGCNKSESTGGDGGGKSSGGTKTMRFMSNIQDREHTEGLVEQMQLDKWLEQNPDFEFDYEFVPNSDYQTKLAQYQATDNLPDIFKEWGGSINFDQRIINKMQIPIWDSPEQANEEGYDYPDGILTKMQISDGSDPAVYATAVNFDFFMWFYNGQIFEKEGWTAPKTWDEFLALLDDMTAKGYVPGSFSGKDLYQGAALMEELLQKISGDNDLAKKIIEGNAPTFSENADARAAFEATKELIDHNVAGGTDWLAQDYAGARGLFVNGQIPLYYFGSWEYMMIADDQLPQEFRDSVDFFLTPLPDGAKGDMGMFQGYTGCGFAIATKSQYKDDALALLKFYFKKENFAKDAWEMKVFIPAQNFSEFQSDKDARLQKTILEVMENRTSVLGNGSKLRGYSNEWNTLTDPLVADFFAGAIGVDDMLTQYDGFAEQARADAEMANS